jgi:hypothetical protein
MKNRNLKLGVLQMIELIEFLTLMNEAHRQAVMLEKSKKIPPSISQR